MPPTDPAPPVPESPGLDLDAIEARHAKATKGPWGVFLNQDGDYEVGYRSPSGRPAWGTHIDGFAKALDAEFVAHSWADIRDFLSLCRSQAATIAGLRGDREKLIAAGTARFASYSMTEVESRRAFLLFAGVSKPALSPLPPPGDGSRAGGEGA